MKSKIYLFHTYPETFQVDLKNVTDKDVYVYGPQEKYLLLPGMKIILNRHSFQGLKFAIGSWTADRRIDFRVKEIHQDKIKTMMYS